MEAPVIEPVFLTDREAAKLLGLSYITLQGWRVKRKGPPWVKLEGKAVRYDREAVLAWAREGAK